MSYKNEGKAVIITGVDSGIGEALTREFLDRGFTVIISYLHSHKFTDEPNLFCCQMDIYKEYDIKHFVYSVKGFISNNNLSLFALINNAGIGIGGSFENMPLDIFRRVFEVNFFGVVSLTQKLLQTLIDHQGKIVMIGSLAGKIASPFLSPYASSKYALEGFCDSLRREMKPLGVQTVLIEPAGIATPIWDKVAQQDHSFMPECYDESFQRFLETFVEDGKRGMGVNQCALIIAKAVLAKRSRPRYLISKTAFMHKFLLLLPDSWLDFLMLKAYRLNYRKRG